MPCQKARSNRLNRLPARRLAPGEAWRLRIRRTFPGIELDWLEDGPVKAGLSWSDFGGGVVVEARVPPLRIGRPAPQVGLDLGYMLLLHLRGSAVYHYAGCTFEQRPGDLVLQDTTRPFEAEHPDGAHVIVWNLPRHSLEPLLAQPVDGQNCRIPGRNIGAILGSHVRTLLRTANHLRPPTERSLQDHLCSLVAIAVGAAARESGTRHATRRALQRQRVLTYLETHLHDPLTTAARAADDLGMSRRWLHALFEKSTEGFHERLIRRRLEISWESLTTCQSVSDSIAEVALKSGFNDLSTFHRQFRRKYGITPAAARQRNLSDNAQ